MLRMMGFDNCMMRWCSLHSLNLGPLVWACGACLELLLQQAIRLIMGLGFARSNLEFRVQGYRV